MAPPPAEDSPVTLVSQREFARWRGCSVQAVNRNTVDHGGVIPTYGAKKQIDPVEAERLWPPRTNGPAAPSQARELDRQRVRKLKAEAARAELELRMRKGELLDRQKGLDTVFRFARMLRDRWQAWPVRIGPLVAAQFGLDPGAVIVVLEGLVRDHLEELSSERCEF
jgi:hypothetical protein